MKIITFLFSTLFCCTLLFAQQDVKDDAKAESGEEQGNEMSAEEQAMWMEYMTPGGMHEKLAKMEGNWTEYMTMWPAPGAPPAKGEAKVENKMIMDGRYIESTHSGEFMGMPFEGRSLMGFDNGKQMFESIWIDNMGTGIMKTTGKWNADKKMIELTGKYYDPMTKKEETVREMFWIKDDGSQYMEMYMTKDGKEYKSMEITMKKG